MKMYIYMLGYSLCTIEEAITAYELITRIGEDNGYKVLKTATVNKHYNTPKKNFLNRSMVLNIDKDNKIISISCSPKKDYDFYNAAAPLRAVLACRPKNFELFRFILDNNLKSKDEEDVICNNSLINNILLSVSPYRYGSCPVLCSLINLNSESYITSVSGLSPSSFNIEFLEKSMRDNDGLNFVSSDLLVGSMSNINFSLLNNNAFKEIFGCNCQDLISNSSSAQNYIGMSGFGSFRSPHQNPYMLINDKIIFNGEYLTISDMNSDALRNVLHNLDVKYGTRIVGRRIIEDEKLSYKIYVVNTNMRFDVDILHFADIYFIEINEKNNGRPIISKKEIIIKNNKLELI